MEKRIETEVDLKQLLGQYESIRLEFKASGLLLQPAQRIVDQLAQEVSAFANTEGGTIVIGIREGKSGKKSIAAEIDEGVEPATMSPESLEQLVASNISPALPGLTVRAIPLLGTREGRLAFVITVPKGSTAYQARPSLRYYTRTEFSASPLHDNVIRLLMIRGKAPHAVIELSSFTRLTADEEYLQRQLELNKKWEDDGSEDLHLIPLTQRAELEKPRRGFDEYTFVLSIRNDGPVTIKDCLLVVSFEPPFETKNDVSATRNRPMYFRFAPSRRATAKGGWKEYEDLPGPGLFPEQEVPFPGASFTVDLTSVTDLSNHFLNWRLYLDDAPMESGRFSLEHEFKAHNRETSSPTANLDF